MAKGNLRIWFTVTVFLLAGWLLLTYLGQIKFERSYEPIIKELLDETCQCTSKETMDMITLKLQQIKDDLNTNSTKLNANTKQLNSNTTYIKQLQKQIKEEEAKLNAAVQPH